MALMIVLALLFSAFWKILMQGPPDTPYEKGVFELYCQFGHEYPVKPPLIRFVTQVSCRNTKKLKYLLHLCFYIVETRKSICVVLIKSCYVSVNLNMITGVPLQCQQCGTHLPQHI